MTSIFLKQTKDGRHPLPKYAKAGDAGIDFYAYVDAPVVLKQLDRALISLGVAMELPDGIELQLRPRSGLALKQGITLCNTPATIDSGYRGEIGAIVINLGSEPVVISDGDKICQGVFNSYVHGTIFEVKELGQSERGEGGYGHTGL